MHHVLLHRLGIAAAFGLCVASVPASAAGLLGERYVSASYDHTFTESSSYGDGSGLTVFYNHPLCENVDLGGRYSYRAWDAKTDWASDFSDQRLEAVATAFGPPELDRIWVQVGAGLGMVEHGDDDTTNFAWSALFGTEYGLGATGVLQPYAGWNDVLNDGDTTTFVYGVKLIFSAGEKIGVQVKVEGDHHYNATLSLGVVGRF